MFSNLRAGRAKRLPLEVLAYYAESIQAERFLVVDRHLWIEVVEYLVAVVGVVLMAWVLAQDFGSPLWGELTSIRMR